MESIIKSAGGILKLPMLTLEKLKDDEQTFSVFDLLKKRIRVGVLVVPQVSLSFQIKKNQESRFTTLNAASPKDAEEFYLAFIKSLETEIDIIINKDKHLEDKHAAKMAKIKAGPVDPKIMFTVDPWTGQFGSYTENGFPQTDINGQPLKKKRLKN
eukprot:UN27334